MFLNGGGNAHLRGLVKHRPAGKSAHANDQFRPKAAEDAAGFPQGADQFEWKQPVAQAAPVAVDPGDPKPFDGIPRGGYFFHFHPAFGAHKKDVALWMPTLDFVSNGQGRVDVATRSPSGDNNAVRRKVKGN